MHPFERLEVWRSAHAVAVEVYALSTPWRDWDLRSQLRRCATSVAANIAEGAGCESQGSFARFVSYAQSSASELRYHLRYAHDVGQVDAETYQRLDSMVESVRRMLSALSARLRANAREDRQGEGRSRRRGTS